MGRGSVPVYCGFINWSPNTCPVVLPLPLGGIQGHPLCCMFPTDFVYTALIPLDFQVNSLQFYIIAMAFVTENNTQIMALASDHLAKLESNLRISRSEEFRVLSNLILWIQLSFRVSYSLPPILVSYFPIGYHVSWVQRKNIGWAHQCCWGVQDSLHLHGSLPIRESCSSKSCWNQKGDLAGIWGVRSNCRPNRDQGVCWRPNCQYCCQSQCGRVDCSLLFKASDHRGFSFGSDCATLECLYHST